MNESTSLSSTIEDGSNETTTQPTASASSTDYYIGPVIIAGSAAGGACALIIIIVLLVCWIKSRRSKMNPPPTLPHPFTIPRYEINDPSSLGYESDEQVSSTQRSQTPDGVPHIWEVQDTVIHSSGGGWSEHDRISYVLMSEPTRPISLSPPSPELVAREQRQVSNKRQLPGVCKPRTGYINVPEEKPGLSPISITRFRNPANFSTHGSDTDQMSTNHNETDLKDYTNMQEIILPEGKTFHRKVKDKEKSFPISPLSHKPSKSTPPDLQLNSKLNKHLTEVHPASSPGERSSSDSDTPASPEHDGYPTSYVNVDKYKKASHIKESVVIDLSKSTFPQIVNSPLEMGSHTKLKPPGVLPKPKLTQQQSPATASPNDTYGTNTYPFVVDKKRQDNLEKNNRKFSSPTIRIEDMDNKTYVKVIAPGIAKPTHSTSPQYLTPDTLSGKIHTENQLLKAQDKMKQTAKSVSTQEDAGVYQNIKSISTSESELLHQSPVTSTHGSVTDIDNKVPNAPRPAGKVQNIKSSLDLNGQMGQTKRKTSPVSSNPAGVPGSPLRDTTFGSSPNTDSAETILEIRSKLRKVN